MKNKEDEESQYDPIHNFSASAFVARRFVQEGLT